MLYAFGKEWLNPVPRASAIELIGKDTSIGDDDKAAIAAFADIGGGGQEHDHGAAIFAAARHARHHESGVMCKAMTIDQALADGQARAEAAMAAP